MGVYQIALIGATLCQDGTRQDTFVASFHICTLIGSRSGHVTEAWPIRASYHPRLAPRRAGDWIRANDRKLFLELALKLRRLSENCKPPCCQQEKKAKLAWRSYKEVETSQTLATRFESLDPTVSDTCFSLPFQLWEPVPRLRLCTLPCTFCHNKRVLADSLLMETRWWK